MQTLNRQTVLALIAGIVLPASMSAQLTIPQMTMRDGMRNAAGMNQVMKDAEQRAKAASASRGAANLGGNWGFRTPVAPGGIFSLGRFAIQFPSNCGFVRPDQGFRLPAITGSQSYWGGIQCGDGTWFQGWMKVLKETEDPVSIDALADEELSSWRNGTYEVAFGELGPQSITRTFASDPRGACQGIVNVENDGLYYTFVLCYPYTPQALWTKEVIRASLNSVAPGAAASR